MASAITNRSFSVLRMLGYGVQRNQLYGKGIASTSSLLNNVDPSPAAAKEPKADESTTEAASPGVIEGVDYPKVLAEKEKLLEESQKQAADFKDKYVRSLAENENILRRNQKLLTDAKLFAIQGFSKDLLEISDILEKATESVDEEQMKTNDALRDLVQGLNMTNVELHKVFAKHGLEKLDPLGKKFDPNFHEALFQIPDPGKEKGTVAVVQKVGYRIHGRTLRAALVGVVQ